MKKKITKMLSIVMISALAVTACSSDTTVTTGAGTTPAITAVMTSTAMTTTAGTTTAGTTTAGTTTTELELTLEELAKYNGQNGQPAYVAVDGIIYDVSNVEPWKGGLHNGFTAGKDLTNEIKTISPHGVARLALVPKVGKIKK